MSLVPARLAHALGLARAPDAALAVVRDTIPPPVARVVQTILVMTPGNGLAICRALTHWTQDRLRELVSQIARILSTQPILVVSSRLLACAQLTIRSLVALLDALPRANWVLSNVDLARRVVRVLRILGDAPEPVALELAELGLYYPQSDPASLLMLPVPMSTRPPPAAPLPSTSLSSVHAISAPPPLTVPQKRNRDDSEMEDPAMALEMHRKNFIDSFTGPTLVKLEGVFRVEELNPEALRVAHYTIVFYQYLCNIGITRPMDVEILLRWSSKYICRLVYAEQVKVSSLLIDLTGELYHVCGLFHLAEHVPMAIKHSVEDAKWCFTQALRRRYAPSQSKLGLAHALSSPPNLDMASKCFKEAAHAFSFDGMARLSHLYGRGRDGVPPDQAKQVQWMFRAASFAVTGEVLHGGADGAYHFSCLLLDRTIDTRYFAQANISDDAARARASDEYFLSALEKGSIAAHLDARAMTSARPAKVARLGSVLA